MSFNSVTAAPVIIVIKQPFSNILQISMLMQRSICPSINSKKYQNILKDEIDKSNMILDGVLPRWKMVLGCIPRTKGRS